ncbi:MAG: WD40 domain-containing protein [Planctomycetota bacterium]
MAEEKTEDYRRALYVSHISLANAEYQGENIGRVQELLESCPNDLRGWEWNYLQHISDQAIKTFRGHQIGKWLIAVSPAGDRIASGGWDKTVVVWDAITGAEIMTLRGHKDSLSAVDYSPDGSHILSSSYDRTIKVWDAITGTQILTITEPGLAAASASFSPDGKRIVSGIWGGDVRIWDAVTGAEVMTLGYHDDDAMSVAFSPDGKRVVSGSWDKTVKIWDATSGGELMTLRGHEWTVVGVSVSPDGKRIASCSEDNTIKVWDLESGTELMTLRGHTGTVSDVAFSPDGRYIASGSDDETLKLWNTASGAEVMTLRGHSGPIGSVVFSPDGKYLASASGDNTIKIWDATIDRERTILASHQEPVTSVSFRPNGKQVVSGSRESTTQWGLDNRPAMSMTLRGQVKIWDVAIAAEVMTLQGDSGVSATAFSADGKRVVTGNMDGTLTIWDATNETRLITLAGHGRPVFSASFSPDDKRVVSGCTDGTIKIWDVSKGVEMVTLSGHRRPVWAVAFSPDGKRIVSGGLDGKAIVWSAATGTQLMTLRGYHNAVRTVAFSPDGKLIASGGDDNTIKIWNAATGSELTTLRGHKSYLLCVAFSPDNKRIVSGSNDRTVRVWDIETGAELMAVRGYADQVRCVTFSPDGQTIAVSNDCNIELLESAPLPHDHELRRTTKNARAIVDRLYEQQGFYHDVISELNSDKEIAEPLRKTALQIADSRRSEDAQKLERESWEVVSSPGKEPESYREALEKAEKACTLEPDSWRFVKTLGAAQYRVGAYEKAVATLRRAEKMRVNARGEQDPANAWFLAMALYQLGLAQEARTSLDGLLRGLWAETSLPIYNRLNVHWQPLRYEAEKLFAGESTKLNTWWEAAEGGAPEQAAQIVEELRALNDTEIAARMESVVKLFTAVYYDRAKSHTFAYPKVIALYEMVVRIDPCCAVAINDLAWLRINCPPDQARDTAKALEEAKKACELTEWKNYHYISTLAAAYSEAGDFDSAVKWQQRAIDLLPEDERTQWQTNYEQRLQLYELGKPYHQGHLWSFSTGKMVGWWKFDEAEGNTVTDSSGNGLHGRLVGDARIVSDPERGSVLSLDGDGDYVDCGNSAAFDITGSITTTAWVKVGTLNMFNKDKTYQVLINKADYAYTWVLSLDQNGGMHFWGYYGLTEHGYEEWGEVSGVIGINDGKWHHVAGVYDGIKMCLYVDGKLDTCDTNWGNIEASNDPLYIGGDPLLLKYGWNGLIDDLRIYSYALSAEEVKMLYEGKEPPRKKGL